MSDLPRSEREPDGERAQRAFDGDDRRAILAVIEAAAREAGEGLSARFHKHSFGRVRSKSAERDLVTEADLEAERCLVSCLRAAFPDHAIEAEEETHDRDDPDDARPRWFLDPLDGTVNFVHGLPIFAVSAGLWVGGRPEVALVHVPRLEETFRATRGGGAWLGDERLVVSAVERLAEAVLATGFPYRRNELAENNLENFTRFFLEVRGLRRMGSAAVDLAYVAAGRLDGFWELHLAPHDVAAGGLLVLEAGGRVTDFGGGEDWLRGGRIVAAGPGLHEEIRTRLRG